MQLTIAVTRSSAGVQIAKSVTNVDIEHRSYDENDPQYLDWLTAAVNPLARSTISAAPGEHIGVAITASAEQPELVNVAWNFKN